MAEASARIKISNPNAPLQPFQFENLPTDRNASLWTRIETTYGLSLEELSALQNARCHQEKKWDFGEQFLGSQKYTALNAELKLMESQAEQFQSSLKNFVERTGFRKRKREDQSFLGAIVAIRSYSTSLQRVFESDYSHDPDIEGTENSPPDNNSELESSKIASTEAVDLTYEVLLQMIEKTDTILLLNQTPERCHLHSSKILEHKKNRNNWIYLSRAMHHQFDGIDTPIKNCPSFVIHYVSHDSSFVDCLINDRGDIQARHRTVVHVYFCTREFFNAFVVYLKDGGQQVAPSTYQMDLFFLDGEQAKFHLDHKEAETRRIWTEKCLTLV
eukprot:gene27383-36151_t